MKWFFYSWWCYNYFCTKTDTVDKTKYCMFPKDPATKQKYLKIVKTAEIN